jgi:CRISPR-associated protein Cas1
LVDVSVVEAFVSGTLELQDFYFTADDYRYHFDTGAKQRFINLLRERFNAGVTYKGRNLKWDTAIEQKTIELGRFLTGKSTALDFTEPSPKLLRHDDRELRGKILALTQSETKRLGIGKSTLHYLRKKSSNEREFTVREKVRDRLVNA